MIRTSLIFFPAVWSAVFGFTVITRKRTDDIDEKRTDDIDQGNKKRNNDSKIDQIDGKSDQGINIKRHCPEVKVEQGGSVTAVYPTDNIKQFKEEEDSRLRHLDAVDEECQKMNYMRSSRRISTDFLLKRQPSAVPVTVGVISGGMLPRGSEWSEGSELHAELTRRNRKVTVEDEEAETGRMRVFSVKSVSELRKKVANTLNISAPARVILFLGNDRLEDEDPTSVLANQPTIPSEVVSSTSSKFLKESASYLYWGPIAYAGTLIRVYEMQDTQSAFETFKK